MAAPDELFCWEGDWGLPSVSTDCLVVLVSIRPHRFDSVRSGSFVPLLHGHISAETPRRSSVLRLINKRETAARSQPAIVFSYCCFRETDAWRDVTTWQATCNTEFSTFDESRGPLSEPRASYADRQLKPRMTGSCGAERIQAPEPRCSTSGGTSGGSGFRRSSWRPEEVFFPRKIISAASFGHFHRVSSLESGSSLWWRSSSDLRAFFKISDL